MEQATYISFLKPLCLTLGKIFQYYEENIELNDKWNVKYYQYPYPTTGDLSNITKVIYWKDYIYISDATSISMWTTLNQSFIKRIEVSSPKDMQLYKKKIYFFNGNIIYCWSRDLSKIKEEYKVDLQYNISCISIRKNYISCGTEDGSFYIWNKDPEDPIIRNKCYDVPIQSLFLDEESIYTCTLDTITKWSFSSEDKGFTVKEKEVKYSSNNPIRSFYTVDSNSIYGVNNEENMLIIWNLNTNEIAKSKALGKDISITSCLNKLGGGKYMNMIISRNMNATGIIY